MKLIIGGRQQGKTAELIKHSAETGNYILVHDKNRAAIVAKQAKIMGFDIPYPVTVSEMVNRGHFRGSYIRRDGLLVDDLDLVIRQLFDGIEINEATVNKDSIECITFLKHTLNI